MQTKYLGVRDVGRVGHVPDAGVGHGAENNPSRKDGASGKDGASSTRVGAHDS